MYGHIAFLEVLVELGPGDFLFVDEKVNMMIGFVVLMEYHVGEKQRVEFDVATTEIQEPGNVVKS